MLKHYTRSFSTVVPLTNPASALVTLMDVLSFPRIAIGTANPLANGTARVHDARLSTSRTAVAVLGILTPPDAVPDRPPTRTRNQRLPFEDLTWENFERLCLRLVATRADVEHCARFGLPGEAQAGIDIFARRSDGTYQCLQAKRQREFGAAKVTAAVDLFLGGEWAVRSPDFTLAVQTELSSSAVQREIERQAGRLRQKGITLHVLDGERLTDALRGSPEIIDDFFGRAWVEAVAGPNAAARLGARLDGGEFARVRDQLARHYDAHFQTIDPGSFGSAAGDGARPALTLLERFTKPDILVREAAPASERADHTHGAVATSGVQADALAPTAVTDTTRASGGADRSRSRRLPVSEWLAVDNRLAILGDAGSGKSTVLRAIALDLLGDQSRFPELGDRFGRHLPVYISFARWASETARDGAMVGIKEIVRRSLQPMLTAPIVDLLDRAIDERRILLLVDGLDEWSAEQAARTTLSNLITLVEANDIPILVSGRPRGVETIGPLPSAWRRGTIAPLSTGQQSIISGTWFERHAPANRPGDGISVSALRTQRFMAELARDPSLGALAATPILLVGLVTLSLRGQILPRTKGEVYDQLIRILLEVHPVRRATASGDTVDRFQHARDPLQRRAAIARLAFETRLGPGDASLPEALARSIVREHLSSPSGCALPQAEAAAAAAEMLSVNSETQGLIIEKGPGEVGFVHASFEEYLAAEHIGGWPLAETVEFVRVQSGEARWRNVLADLMASLPRRDEFDRLVTVIEEADGDELGGLQRAGLLGEIAFTAAGRSPATTRRLALNTLARIEDSDWSPERRDALRTVLRGVAEPTFATEVGRRLRGWAPARAPYRASLVSELGHWKVTPLLTETLWRAMHDEDRRVQRAAAAAYAEALGPSYDAKTRLLEGMKGARSLTASVAMLEALVLGWPRDPETAGPVDEAAESSNPELRLVGSLGRAEADRKSDADRQEALQGQQFWNDLSYPHRELAGMMLLKHWPDDEALLQGALARADGDFNSPWEMELAFRYALNASTDRAEVRRFVRRQLDSQYPFNVMHHGRIWRRVGAFAVADPEVRAAADAHWSDPQHRLISMHKLADYAEVAPNDHIAEILVQTLNGERGIDRYWALDALLRGWGEEHPVVRPVLDKLAALPDERLADVVSLLPRVFPDAATARERILSIASRDGVRRDMVAIGLESLGCDHADNEAVRAILGSRGEAPPAFDPAAVLFRTFAGHPEVRALAARLLVEPEAPLAAIAEGYGDDPEIADALMRLATPLPTDLRSQVVEFAAAGSAGTVLEKVLADGTLEADPDLRVRMMTLHLRSLTDPDEIAGAKRALLAEAHAVGSDHDARRSAALGGLIALGDVGDLVGMQGYNGPLKLHAGSLVNGMPSLERLICERFGLLSEAFGEELPDRFERSDHGSRLAEVLSAAPSASPEARAAFLRMAEDGTMPLTTTALRSLAAERPRSSLLLERCWQGLDRRSHTNDYPNVCAEIALLLSTEFPGDLAIRASLEEAYVQSPFTDKAIALAVFAPESEVLPLPSEPKELRQFGDLAAAMHAIGARGDTAVFLTFLDAMVTRGFHTQYDGQHIINIAVTRRIQRDEDLQARLTDRLATAVHPSIVGSNARQLATAGRLGTEGRVHANAALARAIEKRQVPIVGYDAVGDRWRTLRATLLDALQSEVE